MTLAASSTAVLDRIDCPADLCALTPSELEFLASEIRGVLVDAVRRTGGHLGSNLGVVELTIALHRAFDSPSDQIVFDTGHQSYVHKMLTGRREMFDALRRGGGLSGYPSRAESEHDVVENSHASTALSYADGLSRAMALRGETDRCVIAVVGDGALTGGMCWEALNNLAACDRRVVVVLNDNGRSYAETAGALPRMLRSRPAALFAGLGLPYIGPLDGHCIDELEEALREARTLARPVVVHCLTAKGHGYQPAQSDAADRMHAVSPPGSATARSWTSVFAGELLAQGARRLDVVCLTAAMLRPTGLDRFAQAYPSRTIDVGLAEQHAVTAAAGLAMAGMHPVVAVYSSFLARAFDQVLLDVALHSLPVTFVLDRAGITGPDGPSHHGMWDLSLLAPVPGMRIAAPRDATRLRELLGEALAVDDGPTALRFPKGSPGPDLPALRSFDGVDVLHDAPQADVLLVAVGSAAPAALEAAAICAAGGIGVTVCDPRWPIPPSPALVELAAAHRLVICAEDNVGVGGAGANLCHALAEAGLQRPFRALGLPRQFLTHDTRADILRRHRLDATGIAEAIAAQVDGRAA